MRKSYMWQSRDAGRLGSCSKLVTVEVGFNPGLLVSRVPPPLKPWHFHFLNTGLTLLKVKLTLTFFLLEFCALPLCPAAPLLHFPRCLSLPWGLSPEGPPPNVLWLKIASLSSLPGIELFIFFWVDELSAQRKTIGWNWFTVQDWLSLNYFKSIFFSPLPVVFFNGELVPEEPSLMGLPDMRCGMQCC